MSIISFYFYKSEEMARIKQATIMLMYAPMVKIDMVSTHSFKVA